MGVLPMVPLGLGDFLEGLGIVIDITLGECTDFKLVSWIGQV